MTEITSFPFPSRIPTLVATADIPDLLVLLSYDWAMQRAWCWYRTQLLHKPLRTQIITSGMLWATGDCLAQSVDISLEDRASEDEKLEIRKWIDWRRVAVCSSFGMTFVGPFGHLWYQGLEYLVNYKFKLKPNSMKFIGTKVFMDCFLFGPVHLLAFFSYMSISSGKTLELLKEDLERDFIPAFMVDGAIWPAVQIINFRYVPVHHQLLFVNIFCLADSAFLSWFKHQEDAPWKRWLSSFIVHEKS